MYKDKVIVEGVVAGIDWVIAGGESGQGTRPMFPEWARSLRDQCVAAKIPFFFKQWGAFRPGLTELLPAIQFGVVRYHQWTILGSAGKESRRPGTGRAGVERDAESQRNGII